MTAVAPEFPDVAETAVSQDEVLAAIDELVEALAANARRIQNTIERADAIRRDRALGLSYREIEAAEGEAVIVALTRQNLATLAEAASRLRRAEARALYDEGMTMEQIAALFGVTRQRVSALLRARVSEA